MSPARLYALVGGPGPAASIEGASGEAIAIEPAGDIWLALGDVEACPDPTPDALRAHDAAVRRLHDAIPALLPARFGQLAPDRDTLVRRFAPQSARLRRALDLVDGCVQMTLRIHGVSPPPRVEGAANPGTNYLEHRRLLATGAGFSPAVDALRAAVAPCLRAERAAWSAGEGLLSFYHLLPRAALDAYRRALAPRRAELGARSTLSGPWPPYAYADV